MNILRCRLGARKVPASAFMLAACLAGSMATNVFPQGREASEYQIKAAFLYNFARFVERSQETSADVHLPIVIAIVGDDPFGDTLDETIRGKSVNGRPLMVRRVKKAEDAKGCQIAFISSSERPRLRSIVENLDRAGVLTVGDTEGFAQLGGVINFNTQENKVRFEINLDAADRAGLKISSKLLSLARIVKEQDHRRKN